MPDKKFSIYDASNGDLNPLFTTKLQEKMCIRDSKWTIYTERHGFEQPEFTCANVQDMLRHINSMAPETWRGDPQPAKAPRSPQKKRKEAER